MNHWICREITTNATGSGIWGSGSGSEVRTFWEGREFLILGKNPKVPKVPRLPSPADVAVVCYYRLSLSFITVVCRHSSCYSVVWIKCLPPLPYLGTLCWD